jgi:hypothetical protein
MSNKTQNIKSYQVVYPQIYSYILPNRKETDGSQKIGYTERENVDEDVLECGRGILGKVEVDIMTPLDPEKSPKVHIPPLNHIGLWVDDLPKCVEHLESKMEFPNSNRKWLQNCRWYQKGSIWV